VYSIGLIINVRERKFHANFDVENVSSKERKFSGTKVPVTIHYLLILVTANTTQLILFNTLKFYLCAQVYIQPQQRKIANELRSFF